MTNHPHSRTPRPTSIELSPTAQATITGWCRATNRNIEHLSPTDLDALDIWWPLSTRLTTQRRRALGEPPPPPKPQPARALRRGDHWLTAPQTLAALPRTGKPGFRGRRDAFVVVLIGCLTWTRQQVSAVQPEHIDLRPAEETHPVLIAGTPLSRAKTPAPCPACAITRWLRVARRMDYGRASTLDELNDPASRPRFGHDCARNLPDGWQGSSTLLPAIDQHGWPAETHLTTRSLTTIMGRRQNPTTLHDAENDDTPPPPTPTLDNWTWNKHTSDELTAALEDIDTRLNEAIAASERLLTTQKPM